MSYEGKKVTPGSDTHPTNMTFRLLATRRFMLDNEVTISEFVPGTVARQSLQNAVMPYCAAEHRRLLIREHVNCAPLK